MAAEQVGNTARVTAVSPAAQRGGVGTGMTLASARALLPRLHVLATDREADRQALESFCAWARAFGPCVALYGTDAVMVETSGSVRLFGSEAALLATAIRGAAKLGYWIRAALADTPRAAHALTFQASRVPPIAPAGGVREAVEHLPPATLMLDAATLEALAGLGLTSIGALLALPRAALPARFGDTLPARLAELLGEAAENLVPLELRGTLAERMEFDPPVEDGDSLRFIAKRLVDRVSERLRGTGLGARSLALRFYQECAATVTLQVNAAQPQSSAKTLLLLVLAKLEGAEELDRIVAAELAVTGSAPVAASTHALYDSRPPQAHAGLSALLDRLAARLGMENVTRAALVENHRPELAWRGEPFLAAAANGTRGDTLLPLRPLRLLPDPQPIDVMFKDGALESMDGKPLLRAEGPERIVCGWWARAARRDYWRAQQSDGTWLWLYRDIASGGFFLHGVFV